MNREDKEKLLLTDEQRDTIWKDNWCSSPESDSKLALCEAQLDKVFNQPWLEKPDSEGWWWWKQVIESQVILNCVKIEQLDWESKGMVMRFDTKLIVIFPNGKWQKAIVPELPEES